MMLSSLAFVLATERDRGVVPSTHLVAMQARYEGDLLRRRQALVRWGHLHPTLTPRQIRSWL